MPSRAATALLGRWTRGLEVALCLHRVSPVRRRRDPLPSQTIPPRTLDSFLALSRASREAGGGPSRVVVTFDDGYQDAFEYVRTRAPSYPEVEWLLFVCPEKLETRAGFRWDLWEHDAHTARPPIDLESLKRRMHPVLENRRRDLLGLGDRPEYRQATVEECRRVLEVPNVALGNHTNTHLSLASVDEAIARLEIERSTRCFERMFGECRHFAFPFGVPDLDFHDAHVKMLREILPSALLWTSGHRPYRPAERRPGALLPRVGPSGHWSHKSIAAWLALLGKRELGRERGPTPKTHVEGARARPRSDAAQSGPVSLG